MSSPILRFGQLRIFYGPEKTDSGILKTTAIATGALVAVSLIFTAGLWAGYQFRTWSTASSVKPECDPDSTFDLIGSVETDLTQGIEESSCNHSSTRIVPQGMFQRPSETLVRGSSPQGAFVPVSANDYDTDSSANDSFDYCRSLETTPRVNNSALASGTTSVRVINPSQILMVPSLLNLGNVSSSDRGSEVVIGNRSVAGSSAPDLLFTRAPSSVPVQEIERRVDDSGIISLGSLPLPLENERNFQGNYVHNIPGNSFSTVSPSSSISTAQTFVEGEYVILRSPVAGRQNSSGENTARRSRRSSLDNFSGAASSTESIPLVSPRAYQGNLPFQRENGQ